VRKTENVRRLFFRLAIPAAIVQFATLVYNIADRIYIEHIPSIGAKRLPVKRIRKKALFEFVHDCTLCTNMY